MSEHSNKVKNFQTIAAQIIEAGKGGAGEIHLQMSSDLLAAFEKAAALAERELTRIEASREGTKSNPGRPHVPEEDLKPGARAAYKREYMREKRRKEKEEKSKI